MKKDDFCKSLYEIEKKINEKCPEFIVTVFIYVVSHGAMRYKAPLLIREKAKNEERQISKEKRELSSYIVHIEPGKFSDIDGLVKSWSEDKKNLEIVCAFD